MYFQSLLIHTIESANKSEIFSKVFFFLKYKIPEIVFLWTSESTKVNFSKVLEIRDPQSPQKIVFFSSNSKLQISKSVLLLLLLLFNKHAGQLEWVKSSRFPSTVLDSQKKFFLQNDRFYKWVFFLQNVRFPKRPFSSIWHSKSSSNFLGWDPRISHLLSKRHVFIKIVNSEDVEDRELFSFMNIHEEKRKTWWKIKII